MSNRGSRILSACVSLSPLVPFVVFVTVGVFYTGAQSFGFMVSAAPDTRFSNGYAVLYRSAWFYRSLLYSVGVASAATAFSVLGGTLIALGLRTLPERLFRIGLVYKIPLILPHVVIGLVVLVAFGRSGFIARVFEALGGSVVNLVVQSLIAPINPPGTGALVFAYVLKSVPFVTLLVYAVLRRFDTRQVETARMLGAGVLQRFRSLLLPVIAPPAATAGVIVFLFSFGAFDLPFLLGGSRRPMLAIDVFNRYWYRDLAARPAAMASLIVMFAISVVFAFLYFRLVRRQHHGVRHV